MGYLQGTGFPAHHETGQGIRRYLHTPDTLRVPAGPCIPLILVRVYA